jgi:diguanylate cyclase (GGDEF)-like protein
MLKLIPAPVLFLITPDAMIAAWFQQFSKTHHYQLHWCASVDDGVAIAAEIALRSPALILLATDLATIDSYHLCTMLPPTIQNRPLPVLFVGTPTRPCDRERVFAVGGADYLGYPFCEAEAIARLTLQLRLITIAVLTESDDDDDADLDPLKTLPNSQTMTQYLIEQWDLLAQQTLPLTLLLCQINAFMAYEEIYGFRAGQRCFAQVGQNLYATLAETHHFLARYRDDQFMIALPQCCANDASAIAHAMTQRIQALQINHPRQAVTPIITISIGIASLIPRPTFSYEVMLRAVEAALTEAHSQPQKICLKAFND